MGYAYGYGYGHTWRHNKRVTAVVVGGGSLLVGEANGWATDFLYPTDANRVALKASSAITYYPVDGFYQNASTSPKMVYDASGLLGWSPHNLYISSEDMTSVLLAPSNTTAPTATRLQEIATNSGHSLPGSSSMVSVAGQPYCYWVEATAAECDRIMLYGLNLAGKGLGFDLTNGTTFAVDGIPSDVLSSGILALGGGRYRCWIAVTAGGTTGSPGLYMCSGTAFGYLGNTSRGVTIHRQQLNRGTVPTAYLPTTTAARIGLALDYDPVTHAAKGLLCEPQATNLAFYSADFTTGYWVASDVTVTANDAVAPDGTMTADKIVFARNGGVDQIYQNVVGANGAYTISIYVKGTVGQTVDLSDAAGADFKHTLTGGWDRVKLTSTVTNPYLSLRIGVAAETASTIWAWGGQIEAGTVATSPIPTLAATVTRAADEPSVLPAAINYSTTASSWWVDVEHLSVQANGRIIGYSATGATPIHVASANTFAFYDGIVYLPKVVTSILGRHKMAVAFQNADRAITVDGLAVATDTTAGLPFGTPGASIGIGTQYWAPNHCYVRQVRYLPRRPTNTELVSMTT